MNVLILGGNGYLGSKVARELVNAGYNVVCTKRQTSNLSRLSDLEDKLTWIPATVESIEAASQYTKFDYVLNMACNYGRSDKLYDNVIEANIEFPLKVLSKVVENGTRNYLTIGTGLPDDLNMYSFSKKMFNQFGQFYAKKHNINFVCLTLEMLYGADEPENRFLPSVIRKMLKGESVDMTAGTQHRDIISVDDICKAVLMVMHCELRGYWEIPIGTGIAPTVSELIDYIWRETDSKSKVNKGVIPMRDNEPDCVADTTTISSLGEWEPIPWKKGIKNMIDSIAEKIGGGYYRIVFSFSNCSITLV